jgi:ATP-binding cassette subfamily B protein
MKNPETASLSHEFYFNKKHPLKTFYHFFDREQKNLVLAGLFYIIKHSPVWAMPVILANIINALSSAVTNPAMQTAAIHRIIINLVLRYFIWVSTPVYQRPGK